MLCARVLELNETLSLSSNNHSSNEVCIGGGGGGKHVKT